MWGSLLSSADVSKSQFSGWLAELCGSRTHCTAHKTWALERTASCECGSTQSGLYGCSHILTSWIPLAWDSHCDLASSMKLMECLGKYLASFDFGSNHSAGESVDWIGVRSPCRRRFLLPASFLALIILYRLAKFQSLRRKKSTAFNHRRSTLLSHQVSQSNFETTATYLAESACCSSSQVVWLRTFCLRSSERKKRCVQG